MILAKGKPSEVVAETQRLMKIYGDSATVAEVIDKLNM